MAWPLVVAHLLDGLVLVVVLVPFSLELLCPLATGLFLFVFHRVGVGPAHFLGQSRVEFCDVESFGAVGLTVLLGALETGIEGDFLLALLLGGHDILIALSGDGGTSELFW